MFEFTEDKKGIRPKWVGTIENNLQRRAMMILLLLPTMAVVIGFNLVKFVLFTLLVFSRLVVYGTLKVIITPFLNWPYWHEPRRPDALPLASTAEQANRTRMLLFLGEFHHNKQRCTDFMQGDAIKTLPPADQELIATVWFNLNDYAMLIEQRLKQADK